MLTHCLHIGFGNSTAQRRGVTDLAQIPIGIEDSGVSPCMRPAQYPRNTSFSDEKTALETDVHLPRLRLN